MSRRQSGWLVLGCAAFARLLYLVIAPPDFQNVYWDLAGDILQRSTLGFDGVPTTQYEALYPMVLAAMCFIVADHVFAAQVLQVLIGSLGAIWLYDLAEALTANRRVAFIASLLFAFNPLLVRHAGDSTDLTLHTMLLVGFCRAFVLGRTMAGAAIAGVWLGLAALTRAMVLPLVALGAFVLMMNHRARDGVVFAVTALAVFAPYAIRNYGHNGTLLPSRTGINLFVSNSEYTDALVPEYQADWLEPYAEETHSANGVAVIDPPGPALERHQDRILTRLAWTNIKANPLENVVRRFQYVGYFFSPFLVPRSLAPDERHVELRAHGEVVFTGGRVRPFVDRFVYTTTFVPILALAIGGIWRRRHEARRDAIMWSLLATFTAVHSIFFPATRYRTPMEFVLLFYVAVAIDALAGRWSMLRRSLTASVA